jgi:hypothetical protein
LIKVQISLQVVRNEAKYFLINNLFWRHKAVLQFVTKFNTSKSALILKKIKNDNLIFNQINMKKTTIQIIILLLSINLCAQESRFEIGLQGGYYKANDYNKIKPGNNFSADLKYFFTNKLFVSSFANYGKSWYLENKMSNVLSNYDYGNGTNAEIFNIIAGLTIGYQQTIFKVLEVSGQFGIGSYTEKNTYSYQYDEISSGPHITSFTDLTFPLKVGIGFSITKHLNLSIIGGTNIEPDYPFVGTHLGPRISYVF